MNSAAFYDVDGTLVATTVVHPCLWYAAHQALPSTSLARTAALLARLPFYWAIDQVSRTAFNVLFYREYRGMTHNRLVTLADEMFESMLRPKIFPQTRDLVARSRARGELQVLVTGAIDITVAPLARYLGIEHVIANRLVFEKGRATGALAHPVIASRNKATCMRAFAKAHRIDLRRSSAYADAYADLPMLRCVGYPAAVRPEFRLRREALRRRWPVIEWRR